jgi:thiol-disulfide isomerase/thioredoxin
MLSTTCFGCDAGSAPACKTGLSVLSRAFWLAFVAEFPHLEYLMKGLIHHSLVRAILLLGAVLVARADDAKLAWQPSGVADKLGFRPMRLILSPEKPDGIKIVPTNLVAPLYGHLQFGPAEAPAAYFLILDEPPGQPSRLFVDANGNGDFTDDPPATWVGKAAKGTDGASLTNFLGGADLRAAYGSEKVSLHLGFCRFDPHDASRPDYVNYLFYYTDYARVGDVSVGGQSYKAMLLDEFATGDFRPSQGASPKVVALLLDLNHDGKFQMRSESFDVSGPFKVGDAVYEVTSLDASGRSLQIIKSSKTVAEPVARVPRPPRQNLSAGAKSPPFEAKTTDGSAIQFPQSYKGKLVLLDFWATWCPPCRAEIPGVSEAYEKYHNKGFEILGVSLDQANGAEMLAEFTKDNHMAWPEVYDGGYWQAAVAKTYSIESIPHAFLVDGDTGLIVAEGDSIRGENLAPAIEKALAKHP